MVKQNNVNIALGDEVSKMLYVAAKKSFKNRPGAIAELHPSFSGLRAIHPDYKPADCFELLGSDGVGTKVEIAERLQDYSTVAHDLFAMVCDDAVVRGAEPIAINTVLDVNQLLDNNIETKKAVQDIVAGYVEAARLAKVVILNGELAELGDRIGGYGSFHYNWCATLLSYAHKDRILSGDKIKVGHTLIGLGEKGFRSNGLTDVRRVLAKEFGPKWHEHIVEELSTSTLGQLVNTPSIIYSRFIIKLTGGYDIKQKPIADISGIAHITGGGMPSKLGRMLEPSSLGALITLPQVPPLIMKYVQELSGLSDKEAYGKWHMGSGMVIATPEPEKVLTEAKAQRIDAQIIGLVTEEPGIRIKNRGVVKDEEWVKF